MTMANLLIGLEQFDNFSAARDFGPESILEEVLTAVRDLDEREEMEPFFRSILADPGETPHGPAEIADILTHTVTVQRERVLAAFILKGRSFPTVRPKNVAHQIYRLEKIGGLACAVFAASGVILDAAKEQFCSTAKRLGYRYAIFNCVDLARLFVAYGFLCPRDGHRVVAGRCRCGYSPARRILNLLQQESLRLLREARALRQAAGLVVLPTGSGKTRLAAEDAKQFGASHILYVAHTQEILDVAQSEFAAVFGEASITRHREGRSLHRPNCVNLVTIQLLRRNLAAISPSAFDYVVVDEFHHAAAPSYRRAIERAAPAFLLGLTATPFRGDRQDIAELCAGNVIAEFELRTGIETGILCPYHYFGCFDDVDYASIGCTGGHYNIRDLEKALIIPARDTAIVRKWRERAEGKPTLAFCCSHRHAERVAQSFRDEGVAAEVYISSTPVEERRRLAQDIQDGRTNILCVVDVLNEGADLPFIECLLFLRPTESKRIFFQQLGRGLRRYVGKSHCTVVDFIGNFQNAFRVVEYHGLVPLLEDEPAGTLRQARTEKDVFNLPLGCEVSFEDRVIDIFSRQALDPAHATRHNIGRILLYQYRRLQRQLGHRPTRREVDRYQILSSYFYRLVFGSWGRFEQIIAESDADLPM
jgi:superfamily II DNA or RNA helicase